MITYSELCRLGIGSELIDPGGLVWKITIVTDDGRTPRRRCVMLHRGDGEDRVFRLHEGNNNHEWTMADAPPTAISRQPLDRMTSPVPPDMYAPAAQLSPLSGRERVIYCPEPTQCACNSFTLAWYGHDDGCAERKQ